MFKFVDYIPTPSEKHLGLATILAYEKMMLRFKVIPNKEGNNFFFGEASYRLQTPNGDSYLPSFMVDSRSEQAELERIMREGVNRSINRTSASASQNSPSHNQGYNQQQNNNQQANNDGELPF